MQQEIRRWWAVTWTVWNTPSTRDGYPPCDALVLSNGSIDNLSCPNFQILHPATKWKCDNSSRERTISADSNGMLPALQP